MYTAYLVYFALHKVHQQLVLTVQRNPLTNKQCTSGPTFYFTYETIRSQDYFFRRQAVLGKVVPGGQIRVLWPRIKQDLNPTTTLLDKMVKIL